jgi:hypothetical protein
MTKPVQPDTAVLVDLTSKWPNQSPVASWGINHNPPIEQLWRMRMTCDEAEIVKELKDPFYQLGCVRPSSYLKHKYAVRTGEPQSWSKAEKMEIWLPNVATAVTECLGVAEAEATAIEHLLKSHCRDYSGSSDDRKECMLNKKLHDGKEDLFYLSLGLLDVACNMVRLTDGGPEDPWFKKIAVIQMVMKDKRGHIADKMLEMWDKREKILRGTTHMGSARQPWWRLLVQIRTMEAPIIEMRWRMKVLVVKICMLVNGSKSMEGLKDT